MLARLEAETRVTVEARDPVETLASAETRVPTETPVPPATVSFLPGPVEIAPAVREAFHAPPISHRSEAFLEIVAGVRRMLCSLTGARFATFFPGSGTLANDMVAAHLRLIEGTGLILVNGEFGERLVDHARRAGLAFEVAEADWGKRHDSGAVRRHTGQMPNLRWLWSTHCETSTGVLNDLPALASLCQERRLMLCLDCTSSLGAVAADLSTVFLASGVSGKALGAYSGLGMIFHNTEIEPDERVPRYFDLGTYQRKDGVPFTQSSGLVKALHQALLGLDLPTRAETIRRQHDLIRREFDAAGIPVMAGEQDAAPAVISIRLPSGISSLEIGTRLEQRGFLLSFRSDYLLARNVIQICLMGTLADALCLRLAKAFVELARPAGKGDRGHL